MKSSDSASDGIKMDGGYQDSNGRWHNFINHTAITATGTDTVAYLIYDGIDDQSGHKGDGSLTPIVTGMEITSEPASGDTTAMARPSSSPLRSALLSIWRVAGTLVSGWGPTTVMAGEARPIGAAPTLWCSSTPLLRITAIATG